MELLLQRAGLDSALQHLGFIAVIVTAGRRAVYVDKQEMKGQAQGIHTEEETEGAEEREIRMLWGLQRLETACIISELTKP